MKRIIFLVIILIFFCSCGPYTGPKESENSNSETISDDSLINLKEYELIFSMILMALKLIIITGCIVPKLNVRIIMESGKIPAAQWKTAIM